MNQISDIKVAQTNAALMTHFSMQSSQSQSTCNKPTRKRGVTLTQRGWQKLQQAGVLYDDFGKRYTHEELSERSLLDARTVSRVLSCEVKVDRGTLKTFFHAFQLTLEAEDYTQSRERGSGVMPDAEGRSPSTNELMLLKQHILEDLNRLFHWLEVTSIDPDHLHHLTIARQFLSMGQESNDQQNFSH